MIQLFPAVSVESAITFVFDAGTAPVWHQRRRVVTDAPDRADHPDRFSAWRSPRATSRVGESNDLGKLWLPEVVLQGFLAAGATRYTATSNGPRWPAAVHRPRQSALTLCQ